MLTFRTPGRGGASRCQLDQRLHLSVPGAEGPKLVEGPLTGLDRLLRRIGAIGDLEAGERQPSALDVAPVLQRPESTIDLLSSRRDIPQDRQDTGRLSVETGNFHGDPSVLRRLEIGL